MHSLNDKNENLLISKNPERAKRRQRKNLDLLIQYFHSLEGTESFPYKSSKNAFDRLEQTTTEKSQLTKILLTDIIFTALHTTIFEELITTISAHSEFTLPLIEKFSEGTGERDTLINTHTQNHINFLINKGKCDGCSSCEGHGDILHLLPEWHKGDLDYFIKLYFEVQTIYCTLERVLYEYIPQNMDFVTEMKSELINQFRSYIAHYVTRRLTSS